MTYTVAEMPVTKRTYREIRKKLLKAYGPDDLVNQGIIEERADGCSIDMTHIAITHKNPLAKSSKKGKA